MENITVNKELFLLELHALMVKYNVSIVFSVSEYSDTHGLSNERLVITQRLHKSFKQKELCSFYGWSFNAHDVEGEL